MSRLAGYTLVELLITLTICAVLLGLSAPDLGRSLRAQQGEAVINDLVRVLGLARNAAVNGGYFVAVCKSSDGIHCGGAWEQGALVFADHNHNGQLDGGDQVLQQKSFGGSAGTLTLRSFPNRSYVLFTSEGFTYAQNGTFTWCPADGSPEPAQQLVFIQSGRSRLARDRDGDGIREGTDGKPLSCH